MLVLILQLSAAAALVYCNLLLTVLSLRKLGTSAETVMALSRVNCAYPPQSSFIR